MLAKIQIKNNKEKEADIIILQDDGDNQEPCATITIEANGSICVKLAKEHTLQVEEKQESK